MADKQGLFQQANGGTLFLDEVADLPLAMQVKLLRAIQEKTVRAIGDTKEIPVDIRILSATHKNLSQLVQEGAFRQDLYYRINVIELKLPTLNTRRDDIPVLAEHFLGMIAHEWQLETPPSLTIKARARLQQHNFAGNVRELRNVLERALTLAETPLIDISHLGLPDLEDGMGYQPTSSQACHNHSDSDTRLDQTANAPINTQPIEDNKGTIRSTDKTINPEQTTTNLHPYRTNTQHYPSMVQRQASRQTGALSNANLRHDVETITQASNQLDVGEKANLSELADVQLPFQGLEHYLQEQEKQLIITALKQAGWNKTQAAKLLGTTFRSLRYRMKKLDIAEDEVDE
ncbi:hypothetical protein Psyaliredsea_23490 [Psychrobacter alimentarius]